MKKSFLVFCLLISMFIISCAKSGNDGKSAAFNIEAEPTSLDPQVLTDISGFMVTNMTYEPLVRLNEKNEVVPAGAESWTKSEDGKVWTFKIRQGMKWSNGDPVTGKDYFNGIKRGIDPKTRSEYSILTFYIENAENFNNGTIKDFGQVGVKLKDDYTLEFTLSKPAPFFIKTLIMPVYFPVNEKALVTNGEAYATEADKSIYNGPFIMEEWEHNSKVVMKKNPNYWNAQNIKLDTLTATIVADFDAATNFFENKELDLTRISVEKMESYKGKPELHTVPDGRVYYFGFNRSNPVLKNIKIRQALSLAIDRKQLVDSVLNGVGLPASGVVALGNAGEKGDFRKEAGDLFAQFSNTTPKQLFDEGLKELNITPAQVKLKLTVDEKGTGKKEAEFYQAQWKEKLGIDVEVEVLTTKERIARAKAGEFDIVRYGWGPDYADPMTYLEIFHSKAKDINFAKYSNPEYDKLIDLAKVNQDNKTRMDAMKKAEKLLSDDFTYSALYYQVGVYLINPNLKGVVLRSVGDSVDFYNAYVTK